MGRKFDRSAPDFPRGRERWLTVVVIPAFPYRTAGFFDNIAKAEIPGLCANALARVMACWQRLF